MSCSRIPVNRSFYVYIILKELNIIGFNHNSLKKKSYMKKYEDSTSKIYIRNIKDIDIRPWKYQRFNIDIDPTVDFVVS